MIERDQTSGSRRDERRRTLRVRIPPNPRFGKTVRDEVVSFAHGAHISRQDLDDFVFAVGEALANAIEHSASEDVIEIRCQIEPDKILATIIDSGMGFEPNVTAPLPDEFSEHGRGLPIMRRCADIFSVRSVPGRGTAVVLGRYLDPPQPEETSAKS
ncbi:MAG: ATP-binding protein [Candidatus Eremiobacteraeota bacterium]|nr:ATP-binding protein [Candidatus Eremiobacteraeota bacterium]